MKAKSALEIPSTSNPHRDCIALNSGSFIILSITKKQILKNEETKVEREGNPEWKKGRATLGGCFAKHPPAHTKKKGNSGSVFSL